MEANIKEEPRTPPETSSPKRKSKCPESLKCLSPKKRTECYTPPHTPAGKCLPETVHSLSKVRRLLNTLVQHAEEMGCSAGERVKGTILALVAGTISMEEFQGALLEITNRPIRPFVVPYLEAYLPLLQQDVSTQARLRKQGLLEYLSSCETAVLERGTSPSFASEVFGKRRLSERLYEEEAVPIKRPLLVPIHPMAMSSVSGLGTDEQWRNIHVMLNCILSMVEKTKQALALLQHGPREGSHEEDQISHTVRMTEERITQIRKKAEDAITEIKKKAQLELEKATAGLNIPRNRSYPDLF